MPSGESSLSALLAPGGRRRLRFILPPEDGRGPWKGRLLTTARPGDTVSDCSGKRGGGGTTTACGVVRKEGHREGGVICAGCTLLVRVALLRERGWQVEAPTPPRVSARVSRARVGDDGAEG